MRNVIAYKARYSFADTPAKAEKYRAFLMEHILELSPKYYGVTDKVKVLTPEGVMYAVKLVKELDNPEYEIIAECWVNSVHIYLWRDKCWMQAVDKERRPIVNSEWEETNLFNRSFGILGHTGVPLGNDETWVSKTMIIFSLGEPCGVTQQ